MDFAAHSSYHNKHREVSEKTRELISQKTKTRLSNKKNHPRYKDIDMDEVKRLRESGVMLKDIAKKYNISRHALWKKAKE